MDTKVTLDMLTKDGVSVKTQQFTTIEGVEYPIGEPHRRNYINSASDRAAVTNEVPEPYRTAIFEVWGSEPTIEEPEEEPEE